MSKISKTFTTIWTAIPLSACIALDDNAGRILQQERVLLGLSPRLLLPPLSQLNPAIAVTDLNSNQASRLLLAKKSKNTNT